MDIHKIAWLLFIVGAGLAFLAWIGSVPTNVQWYGVVIALIGAVLSLFSKSKRAEQKGTEEAVEPDKASDEEGGEEKGADEKAEAGDSDGC